MIHLYVPDIGDGLAAAICTIGGSRVQLDCGSQQDGRACERVLRCVQPDYFLLSHFHLDHYNGLVRAAKSSHSFPITTVFFPRMPELKTPDDRKRFMVAMLAMNLRILGKASGSIEWDFKRLVEKIAKTKPQFVGRSAGDTICVGQSRFEVLWPPRTLYEGKMQTAVKTALSKFQKALKVDPGLKTLQDLVEKKALIDPYISDEPSLPRESEEPQTRIKKQELLRDLCREVKEANDALRKAANHMSLAFYEDNRILFLGDLEAYELKLVVEDLVKEGKTSFLATITPHHGTHWHRDLAKVKTLYAISSVGKKLIGKLRPEFNSFGSLVTHFDGGIHVPIFPYPFHYFGCP